MDGPSITGPKSEYMVLISVGQHEFVIKHEYAMLSRTIRTVKSGLGRCREGEVNKIDFSLLGIESHVLQKMCIYMRYMAKEPNCQPITRVFPLKPEEIPDILAAVDVFELSLPER